MGRSDAGSAVSNWLVRHREFGQVVADHFWLDFDLVEHLNFDMLVFDVLIGSVNLSVKNRFRDRFSASKGRQVT